MMNPKKWENLTTMFILISIALLSGIYIGSISHVCRKAKDTTYIYLDENRLFQTNKFLSFEEAREIIGNKVRTEK